MTTKEAMEAMLDGKKVRRKSWHKGSYIYFSPNAILDVNGNCITLTFEGDDWEIYEEPKQTVVIEKWLCKSLTCGKEYFFEISTSDIDSYFYDWNDSATQKVKLLETYEVKL